LLRYLPTVKNAAYLILGFVLVSFLSVSVLGVALVGAAAAILIFKKLTESTQGGDIDE